MRRRLSLMLWTITLFIIFSQLTTAAPIESELNEKVTNGTFTQKLCHFNLKVTATWKQRYWQNVAHYVKDGPIFLHIGNNEAATDEVISANQSPLVQWATRLNASLYNLEMRFFGLSRPTADTSDENLKFLNARQAVEDITDFIKGKNVELGLKNPKWILFGSQYGGAVALWHRQLHPDLSVGVLGSSAPVAAQFDFHDFPLGAEAAYRAYNSTCADNIAAGFKQIHQLMDTVDGREQLDTAFNNGPPLVSMNLTFTHIQNFYHVLMGHMLLPVQFNNVQKPPYNTGASIKDVCDFMTRTAFSDVSRIANVVKYMEKMLYGKFDTLLIDYDGVMVLFRLTSYASPLSQIRMQTWQFCDEVGRVPATTYDGFFGPVVPTNYFYGICKDTFGNNYTADFIKGRMQQTMDTFGLPEDYKGTHAIISQGSIDPNRVLGINVPDSKDVFTYVINGTASGADLALVNSSSDPDDLQKFRTFAFSTIAKWISAKTDEEVNDKSSSDVEEEHTPTMRRAPEREVGEICWGCGKPDNEIEHNLPPPAIAARMRRRFIGGRHAGGFVRTDRAKKQRKWDERPTSENKVVTSYIKQALDQFNTNDTRTYNQVFMSNDRYYKEGGPAFLYISGESAADTYWIEDETLPLLTWAKKHNAMLYELEHRFYGNSQPLKKMSVENLRYLTSEQALADVASFIRSINKNKGWKSPKWVSYGGSYAGALSAWFRETYPELTVAAIGSSGPVEAQVDFYGYLQTVEASLRTVSTKCGDTVKRTFEHVHELMNTKEGRKKLTNKLQIIPRFDIDSVNPYNVMAFYSELFGGIMGLVQYGNISGDIKEFCDVFSNDKYTDDLDRIVHGIGTDFGANMDDVIEEFKYDGDGRAWFWQTCNEFGYYQSSDIGEYNMFGSALPVNFYLKWCSDAYDKTLLRDKLDANIKATNRHYGGARKFKSTKVLQLYGTIDPWHYLGYYPVNGSLGEDVVSILINGTSHCADMDSPNSGDGPSMKSARAKIVSYLDKWLA